MDYTIQCDDNANVQNITVPWTIKPSDMFEFASFKDVNTYCICGDIFLSERFVSFLFDSGSACTMVASRFAIAHNVNTYAIGVTAQRPLSYFSFPGGFVMQNSDIVSDLASIHLKNAGKTVPISLPIAGTTSLPVGEIYALENSTLPLEYNSQYFAAAVHLDRGLGLGQAPRSGLGPHRGQFLPNTFTRKTKWTPFLGNGGLIIAPGNSYNIQMSTSPS